ncbi:MAG: FAD binding domain-containing protein [Candidatus Brocadiae bacterium]|nr:FAD binding domain-containing protein [Candidatus Brocadiia bacterium]
MMRCPEFRYHAAKTVEEAASVLADHGPKAMLLAGGTDVVPNLKRRQHRPEVLVSLRRIPGFAGISIGGDGAAVIGPGTTLADLALDGRVAAEWPGLSRAVGSIASPLIRATATLGGNLCLDTRCNYYNQNYEWRQSIRFCMKAPAPHGSALTEDAGGSVCWVAPASPRCWAVSSTDGGPMLAALGATVELRSKARGKRDIAVADLYNDDGMLFLKKAPDEVVTRVRVPRAAGQKSAYWKLRRRGSFDFPVLSVAAAATFSKSGEVTDARVVLGAVASMPLVLAESASLVGKSLTDDVIAEFAGAASRHAKPMDNTDFQTAWRRKVTAEFLTGALRELRGDDPRTMGQLGRRVARGASCLG